MKYCTNCGTKLKDNDKFCPNCGTSIDTEPTFEAKGPVKKSKSKTVIIILCVLVAICLFMLLGGSTAEKVRYTFFPTPSPTPEPTPEPGIFSLSGTYLGPAPTLTTISFGDGRQRKAYAVCPLDYTDWDHTGDWSSKRISFGSVMGNYIELYGTIRNCYGLSDSLEITTKNGTGSVGFKLVMSHNGKWTYGDYHNEERIGKGDRKVLKVYCYDAGTIEGFRNTTASVVPGDFSYSYYPCSDLCLYFSTEEAAIEYIRSIC